MLGLSGGPGGLSSSLFFGEMPCLDLILIPSKLVSSSSSSSSRVSEVERGELGEAGREERMETLCQVGRGPQC